ncbi:protein kinase [Frankia sp. AgB1.9]|uniref:serine/threonine protein kinase n=1 Tax=unclassified Frankia TaxID=2632575 RepID=UPI0019314579|nr:MULTISPECIES: protein kinase [unclassified Frankia]MBL7487287.1 protein kinase [Frankia sp. AgW1.1]MBL7546294.1 protein kinase [Frankia sp. AgB1.9]MBL7618661.1 protein kinase [Frankia sp. AgB1.8]
MSDADSWVGPPTSPETYRMLESIGGGGEGEVWKAVRHLSESGRHEVAVKILPAQQDRDDTWEQNTGGLLLSLHHPNLVRVIEVFTGAPMHRAGAADPKQRKRYVVMDHIDGMSLLEWCDENPKATVGDRLKKLRSVASALDEMHSGTATHVPVAHGDVKPANIVVDKDGKPMLVDLGLARLTDATGVVGYSRPYAAPELREPGAMVTPAADKWAFVVTVAQVLLLGRPLPAQPAAGWLDEVALADALHRNELTSTRHDLIQHIQDSLATPAEARGGRLVDWLDRTRQSATTASTGGDLLPVTGTVAGPWGGAPRSSVPAGSTSVISALATAEFTAAEEAAPTGDVGYDMTPPVEPPGSGTTVLLPSDQPYPGSPAPFAPAGSPSNDDAYPSGGRSSFGAYASPPPGGDHRGRRWLVPSLVAISVVLIAAVAVIISQSGGRNGANGQLTGQSGGLPTSLTDAPSTVATTSSTAVDTPTPTDGLPTDGAGKNSGPSVSPSATFINTLGSPTQVGVQLLCRTQNAECDNDDAGTIPAGGKLFQYYDYGSTQSPNWVDLLKFPANTCTSLVVQFATKSSANSNSVTANLQLLQTSVGPVAATSTGDVGTLTATLDGGPFELEANSSTGDYVYLNGYAVCNTYSGLPGG